jgi:Ras family protein T1
VSELNEFQVCETHHVPSTFPTAAFQRKVFNAPLQQSEVEGIQKIVLESGDGGLRDGCLTESGFLYLFTKFIRDGRIETTWKVLEKFGYGSDLRLTEEFLYPRCVNLTPIPNES